MKFTKFQAETMNCFDGRNKEQFLENMEMKKKKIQKQNISYPLLSGARS